MAGTENQEVLLLVNRGEVTHFGVVHPQWAERRTPSSDLEEGTRRFNDAGYILPSQRAEIVGDGFTKLSAGGDDAKGPR